MKTKNKIVKGRMPYQEAEVGICKYWDYNLRIKGIVYEISVNKQSGKIYVTQDENQGI